MKSWRRRWFALTGTTLTYFTDEEMKRPKRSVPLWRIVRVRCPHACVADVFMRAIACS